MKNFIMVENLYIAPNFYNVFLKRISIVIVDQFRKACFTCMNCIYMCAKKVNYADFTPLQVYIAHIVMTIN